MFALEMENAAMLQSQALGNVRHKTAFAASVWPHLVYAVRSYLIK